MLTWALWIGGGLVAVVVLLVAAVLIIDHLAGKGGWMG